MRMDDVERQAGNDADRQRRRRRAQGRRSGCRCRAIPGHPGRDRDCRRGANRCGASTTSRSSDAAVPRSTRGRAAEQVGETDGPRSASGQGGQDGRIARHQGGRLRASSRERRRQGAHDIGQAAGLHQREDFRARRPGRGSSQRSSRSIIGWVIRQMPRSVRRNRRASSIGVLADHQAGRDAARLSPR